ncbi:hypothetical protein [Anabaena sp. CCY 9910]|uniref:hypothetical protein n=1 Tax=Anabaena sp. CCY 9910 TaxID=3103870 RepID=UPI0039DFCE8B
MFYPLTTAMGCRRATLRAIPKINDQLFTPPVERIIRLPFKSARYGAKASRIKG